MHDSQSRLDALDRALDRFGDDDRSTLAHSMLGSLSALVDDDQWYEALVDATRFVEVTIERRARWLS